MQKDWGLFPEQTTEIELKCEGQVIIRKFNHIYHEFAMGEWFTAYKLKGGDKVIITPIKAREYSVKFLRK